MSQDQNWGLEQLAEFLSGTNSYLASTDYTPLTPALEPAERTLVEWLESIFEAS